MPQPKTKCVNRDQYDAVLFDLDGVITDTANLRNGIVNKVILAVPESAHRFDIREVFRVSLGKFDAS